LNGKIEKKNQFNIRTPIKIMRIKLEKKITYYKFRFNDEIENKPKFYKRVKNKN
jgi:hypothetical protein